MASSFLEAHISQISQLRLTERDCYAAYSIFLDPSRRSFLACPGRACCGSLALRHYVCPKCGMSVGNREVAMKRLNKWLRGRAPQSKATGFFKLRKKKEETPGIICVGCEQRVPLWDEMEQCFASPEIAASVMHQSGRLTPFQ